MYPNRISNPMNIAEVMDFVVAPILPHTLRQCPTQGQRIHRTLLLILLLPLVLLWSLIRLAFRIGS